MHSFTTCDSGEQAAAADVVGAQPFVASDRVPAQYMVTRVSPGSQTVAKSLQIDIMQPTRWDPPDQVPFSKIPVAARPPWFCGFFDISCQYRSFASRRATCCSSF